MNKADLIADFMVAAANNDAHGYSQSDRWGPDYDCSSLVISAAEYAGIPVKSHGATYTGNMAAAFIACGFKILQYDPNIPLLRGDVLLNVTYHTAVYIGNNQVAEAAINELGTVSGGKQGDQTGNEIRIRLLYNYPWNYILRYQEESQQQPVINDPDCNYTENNKIVIYGPQIEYRDYGPAVAAAQGALNYHGFGPVTVDGYFGTGTAAAVKNFQTAHDLDVDGIIGAQTWRKLLYWGQT